MIFIDSGAFIARFLTKDQYHEKAITIWNDIYSKNEKCYTSSIVINETITFVARRTNHSFAAEKGRFIYLSPNIGILRSSEVEEKLALELFEKYQNMNVGFADCLSFSLMKKHNINKAFSFDKHFEMAGFHLI